MFREICKHFLFVFCELLCRLSCFPAPLLLLRLVCFGLGPVSSLFLCFYIPFALLTRRALFHIPSGRRGRDARSEARHHRPSCQPSVCTRECSDGCIGSDPRRTRITHCRSRCEGVCSSAVPCGLPTLARSLHAREDTYETAPQETDGSGAGSFPKPHKAAPRRDGGTTAFWFRTSANMRI